jgi:uncharacterized membrane protein
MRPWPRKPIASPDLLRVVAIGACCLFAAWTPFFAGFSAAFLGLVPLGLAVWLVLQSRWSPRTRLRSALFVVTGTVALFVVFLALSALTGSYN